ncbi:ABC transporter ATP-binding protein/permease [Flavobacteriaceae bacterium]|nr:ABC transporter ATP-binding protein/permease [bacterium]MDA9250591.1 ABC transporter ATP-binding protein/permease [Flavobacteriaceae bacterium]
MNYFGKILKFGLPYKKFAFLNVFFNILYALFSALSYVAMIPMMQILFGTTKQAFEPPVYNEVEGIKSYVEGFFNYKITQYMSEDSGKALMFVIATIITLFFLKNIFNYLAMFFITFLRNGVLKDLRNALYKKTTALPVSFFSEKKKGDLMARISSDVLELQHSFLSVLELIVRDPLTIIFSLIVMFTFSTKLTLFVLIFIPISGAIISQIGKSLKKKSGRVQEEQGEFLSILEETIGGIKIIKAFNSENIFIKKFSDSTQRFFKYSNDLLNRQNMASPVSEFLGILVISILLWYGGKMVLLDQTLNGAIFLSYMGLAYNILTPAKGISRSLYNIKKGDAAAQRVLEILEAKDDMADDPDAVVIDKLNDKIVFKNISFSYENKIILKDFSLNLKKGQTIALVGASGSGKTTVANLLNRFYDINNGALTIDGIAINKIKKSSLYGLTGMVTQDSILFNDTVKNNISLGNPNASEKEIKEAAKIANAEEFILNLENGYETVIGESGNKLSGGQKQRLSIARAILKNPDVLILDEATSALDTASEKLVQNALEYLMKNRTSLVIAHRLSTIQKADLIVVMNKGEIVETGNHKSLMGVDSTYKKLVDLQTF